MGERVVVLDCLPSSNHAGSVFMSRGTGRDFQKIERRESNEKFEEN
jgi:hypothetical protein